MSRIGKRPITIPENVEIKWENHIIKVKGPKGELEREIHEDVDLEIKDGQILVSTKLKKQNLTGLSRTLVDNMVIGVTEGFEKKLKINGVGYRVAKQGKNLNLTLGYSHPVIFEAPEGIEFDVPSATEITVKGINKELVGEVAANIRKKRLPEVYHGKGIKYEDEVIIRKEGKTGK